jgi:hypothetical protein
LPNGEAHSIRCHPNYNSSGNAHYDWGYIKFEQEKQNELFPSRIVAIVEKDKNALDATYLVVQCGVRKLNEEAARDKGGQYVTQRELTAARSKLFKVWMFEPQFYVVPLASYSRPCLVFWNTLELRPGVGIHVSLEGITRIAVADDRSEWASKF